MLVNELIRKARPELATGLQDVCDAVLLQGSQAALCLPRTNEQMVSYLPRWVQTFVVLNRLLFRHHFRRKAFVNADCRYVGKHP